MEKHPITLLSNMAAVYGDQAKFMFQELLYLSEDYVDSPTQIHAGIRNSECHMKSLIASKGLPLGRLEEKAEHLVAPEELADDTAIIMHSLCLKDKLWWHLPMIDFSDEATGVPATKIIDWCTPITDRLQTRLYLYDSGKSYHGYYNTLIDEMEWSAFLGQLLIMGKYVDTKWVGHSLKSGYSTLRWSKRKGRKIRIRPKLVGMS